mmetsp:Transcript_88141/g.128846  ORF Transcript_88141/g.128846 Transcript_88141/m.128846 type:complete len:331 (+) Transcript_88141:3291-4283(+)
MAAAYVACCNFCGKLPERLHVCSKCQNVRYCDKNCQRRHWRAGHRAHCAPTNIAIIAQSVLGETHVLFQPMSDAQRDKATECFRKQSKLARNNQDTKDPVACFFAVECAFILSSLYQLRNKWGEALRFMNDFDDFVNIFKTIAPEGSAEWVRAGASAHVCAMLTNRKMVEVFLLSVNNAAEVQMLKAMPMGSARTKRAFVLAEELLLEQTTWCTLDSTSLALNIDRILQLGVVYLHVLSDVGCTEDMYSASLYKYVQFAQKCIERALALMESPTVPPKFKSRARHLEFYLKQLEYFNIKSELLELVASQGIHGQHKKLQPSDHQGDGAAP